MLDDIEGWHAVHAAAVALAVKDGDRQTLIVVGPALAVVAFVALCVVAATRDDLGDRTVWFAAIAAGIAFVGVVAAAVTLYLSDVLEKPLPLVWIEVPNPDGDGYMQLARGESARVRGVSAGGTKLAYEARIHVTNKGRGVLRWGIINVQVVRECEIDPIRALPTSGHNKATTPFDSGELRLGRTVLCNATVAERDYPPGHSFLYSVLVTVPHAGEWPIAAIVDGFPTTKKVTRAWTRADITVSA